MNILTTKEVAEKFKISKTQVMRFVHSGRLKAVRITPHTYHFREEDVEKFIEENEACIL